MAKQPKFQIGDTVKSSKWIGVFTIVNEIDGRFAIQNHIVRSIAHPQELTLINNTETE